MTIFIDLLNSQESCELSKQVEKVNKNKIKIIKIGKNFKSINSNSCIKQF